MQRHAQKFVTYLPSDILKFEETLGVSLSSYNRKDHEDNCFLSHYHYPDIYSL